MITASALPCNWLSRLLWLAGHAAGRSYGARIVELMTNEPTPQPTQPAAAPVPALNPGRDPWAEARRRYSVVGIALVVMVLCWIGLNILASQVLLLVWPDGQVPAWGIYLASSGPLYLIAMPLSMLAFMRVPALPTRQFRLGGARFVTLLLVCLPIMYAGSIVGMLLSALISGGQASNRLNETVLGSNPLVNLVFVAVLAPVAEEWLFRKQIIDRTRVYGEKTAILISALAFALFHLNLYQFFYAFGLGLVFGYTYMRTSRLRYSVLMHMIINFNGGVVAPWLLTQVTNTLHGSAAGADTGTMSDTAMMQVGAGVILFCIYGFMLLCLVIAGIVLLIVRRRRVVFYTAPMELPRGHVARTAFGNPGMIMYILLAVALTVAMTLLNG